MRITSFRLFCLGWLLTLAAGVSAQQTSDIDLDQLRQSNLIPSELRRENLTTIKQVGNGNEVEIIQQQYSDQQNKSVVYQEGNENLALLSQSGWNNEVILLQNGSDNTVELDLLGSENEIAIIQNGDQNEVFKRLIDSRNVNVEFIQNGESNLIEYQGEGLLSKDIKVLQDGDNMHVIINQTTNALPAGNP